MDVADHDSVGENWETDGAAFRVQKKVQLSLEIGCQDPGGGCYVNDLVFMIWSLYEVSDCSD